MWTCELFFSSVLSGETRDDVLSGRGDIWWRFDVRGHKTCTSPKLPISKFGGKIVKILHIDPIGETNACYRMVGVPTSKTEADACALTVMYRTTVVLA